MDKKNKYVENLSKDEEFLKKVYTNDKIRLLWGY